MLRTGLVRFRLFGLAHSCNLPGEDLAEMWWIIHGPLSFTCLCVAVCVGVDVCPRSSVTHSWTDLLSAWTHPSTRARTRVCAFLLLALFSVVWPIAFGTGAVQSITNPSKALHTADALGAELSLYSSRQTTLTSGR